MYIKVEFHNQIIVKYLYTEQQHMNGSNINAFGIHVHVGTQTPKLI